MRCGSAGGRLFLKIALFLSCLWTFILGSTTRTHAQEVLAPLNPDFIAYMYAIDDRFVDAASSGSQPVGFIPPPVDLPYLTAPALLQASPLTAAPAAYDLRTLGKVSPVRDQGACGSCWAFSAYASLESNLLPSEAWDFSENNLKNRSGFDMGPCDGGNAQMSMAYLVRWGGPVAETDDPYGANSSNSPRSLPVDKHVQEVLILPDRTGPSDNAMIKQAIMGFGALSTTLYQDNQFYNREKSSYYYNGYNSSNHAVAIVGWDDAYEKTNFLIVPPGNGAFIVKNSWGEGWGEGGYFYVSYYDSNIGKYNHMFNNAEEAPNYGRIYEHDPLGWTAKLGFGDDTAWFANVFTAVADESLTAVSFYVASPDSPYEIYVYTDVGTDPVSGLLQERQAGVIDYAGYHTIPLVSDVPLVIGQRFSVVVKLTCPYDPHPYPVPLEYRIPGFSSRATANPGESFISRDGARWTDLNADLSQFKNSNVCIKAFTLAPPYPRVTLLAPNAGEVIPSGSTYTISWGAPPEALLFNLYYSWNDGLNWRLINKDDKVPRKGDVTDLIWTAPTPSSGNRNHCRIKVVGYDASGEKVVGKDRSDGSFRIEVVKLTSPDNTGLLFTSNDSIAVEWTIHRTRVPITKVKLLLTQDGGATWTLINPALPGDFGEPGRHRFVWKIPPMGLTSKEACRLKVVLKDGSNIIRGSDRSNNSFMIQPP